jgi:hypothetical protein
MAYERADPGHLLGSAVVSGFGRQPTALTHRTFHSWQRGLYPCFHDRSCCGVALRESKIAKKNRRLIWCAFLSSFAFAPTVVALTPLLVARRK